MLSSVNFRMLLKMKNGIFLQKIVINLENYLKKIECFLLMIS